MSEKSDWHTEPENDLLPVPKTDKKPKNKFERPVSKVYPVIDNDLARDNIENDLTDADLQDL